VKSHPKGEEMFKCEAHSDDGKRALIRYGGITECPLCAVAFITSIAYGAAAKLSESAEVLGGKAPVEVLASAIIKQAFEDVSLGRWRFEDMTFFVAGEAATVAHPRIPPDAFVGALIEIDTTALNKPVSPTPTAPRPQGEQ
jgi:hypothetical protein